MFNKQIIYLVLIFTVLISGCKENRPSEQMDGTPSSSSQSQKIDQYPKSNSSDRSDELINSVIDKVMAREYPLGLDETLRCWKYTFEVDGNKFDYCMVPKKGKFVATGNDRKLYFFAHNKSDAGRNSEYIYSHVDTGMMGAFEVTIDPSGKWSLSAATKDMEFGSAGSCGCENADFIRLGKDRYGWAFTSGGTSQGKTVAFHSIVTTHGDRFEDVSKIPMINEESSNTEYAISIDDSTPEKEMFPLIVTMTHDDSEKSKKIKIDFNFQEWTYQIKEDQT